MAKEKVMVSEQYLQDIANSIRTKLEIEDKYKPSEFSSKIDEMNIAIPVTKGFIINEYDEDGYPTDASIVGMTKIPNYYLWYIINDSNGSWMSKIGANLHLPDDLTEIGDYAFAYCSSLTSINLPNSLTIINSYAFSGCRNLALTELPNGLTKLYGRAFNGCTKLALTELPDSLTHIETEAFRDCKDLALTSLSDNITYLGQTVFQGCTNIVLTELPKNLTSVPYSLLQDCTSITQMYLHEKITSIGMYAFYRCTSLTKLTMDGNITKIDSYALQGCSTLSELIMSNVTRVPTLSNTNTLSSTPIAKGTGYIYVPDALVDSFKTASNWSTYAAQIKPISELPTE